MTVKYKALLYHQFILGSLLSYGSDEEQHFKFLIEIGSEIIKKMSFQTESRIVLTACGRNYLANNEKSSKYIWNVFTWRVSDALRR